LNDSILSSKDERKLRIQAINSYINKRPNKQNQLDDGKLLDNVQINIGGEGGIMVSSTGGIIKSKGHSGSIGSSGIHQNILSNVESHYIINNSYDIKHL
jgi:hypothetical protein